jgi:hypothetical protein
MNKKFKIKELENEADLKGRDLTVTKISMESLDDDPSLAQEIEPSVKVETNKTSIIKKQNPKSTFTVDIPPPKEKVVENNYVLKYNQTRSYFFKSINFFFIFICIEVLNHLLKMMDGIDILDVKNFDSLTFGSNMELNVAKVGIFFLLLYFFTPEETLILNRHGVFCKKNEIQNLFFKSKDVLMPWQQIMNVEHKMKLFEPYLFLYDIHYKELGRIHLTLENPKDFFILVEQFAGSAHPIMKFQKKMS